MKLKICGMREPENIKALAALTPDYMGFIFWAPSSRFVEGTTPTLPQHIKKTGVFVDASVDYIQTVVQDHYLQARAITRKRNSGILLLRKVFGCRSNQSLQYQRSF
jgi:phosphoribosylanthranilate isomerase